MSDAKKELNPREKKLKSNKIQSLIVLLISIVLTIVSFVISGALGENGTVVSFILFILTFAFWITTILLPTYERKRIKRSYCPECGEKYDYQDDVSWEVSDVVTKAKSQVARVEFECTCHECGHTTEFAVKFTTATIDEKGNIKQNNVKNQARKYFIK